jgi:endonuclease YncB( thermonuclease family)
VAYRLLTGRFVLRYAESPGAGPTPDGDTLKFRPDDPALVEELGLASGVEPTLSAQYRISLRLQAVDALELNFEGSHQEAALARAARDGLLARLGFADVVWDPARPAQAAAANADEMPGWVLADGIEQNGRLVAFAYPGGPPLADGSQVAVDEAMLRVSVNLRMLAEGLVYPMLYTSLPVELRDLCREVAAAARAARRGVWKRAVADPGSAADLSRGAAALPDLVMWPKLFRRLARYFATGRRDPGGFRRWLAAGPADRDDAVLVLDTGQLTRLHEIVAVDGDRVRLSLWPDAFAVLPVRAGGPAQVPVVPPPAAGSSTG